MYLKVPYGPGPGKQIADPEAVKAALPADISGLIVDTDLGYPCVEFPRNAPYTNLERVRETLRKAGFETD